MVRPESQGEIEYTFDIGSAGLLNKIKYPFYIGTAGFDMLMNTLWDNYGRNPRVK